MERETHEIISKGIENNLRDRYEWSEISRPPRRKVGNRVAKLRERELVGTRNPVKEGVRVAAGSSQGDQ